jgi:hypothetical protein
MRSAVDQCRTGIARSVPIHRKARVQNPVPEADDHQGKSSSRYHQPDSLSV